MSHRELHQQREGGFTGATYPREADAANGVAEDVSQHGRVGRGCREISEELRRLPVRHLSHQEYIGDVTTLPNKHPFDFEYYTKLL